MPSCMRFRWVSAKRCADMRRKLADFPNACSPNPKKQTIGTIMKPIASLSIAAGMLAGFTSADAAITVFQIDFQRSDGTIVSQESQSGWTAWGVLRTTEDSTITNSVGGVGLTLTALGTNAKFESRGGEGDPDDDRGGEITGTSWNDVVEDLITARNGTGTGAGDMSITLTGLSVGHTYTLTGWHNDSYPINEGFASTVGYAVTPSITLGTLVGLADAGASTNHRPGAGPGTSGAWDDADFNTSVISFTSDGSGNATILLTGDSASNFLVLNGLQLSVPEPSAALLGGLGMLILLRRRR